jgi:hypothetical protein
MGMMNMAGDNIQGLFRQAGEVVMPASGESPRQPFRPPQQRRSLSGDERGDARDGGRGAPCDDDGHGVRRDDDDGWPPKPTRRAVAVSQ